MTETFTSVAAVKLKAGENFDSSFSDGNITSAINHAEATINVELAITDVNLVTDYSNLATGVKEILGAACSSLAAMEVINYNASAYQNGSEARSMLNYNWTIYKDAMRILKEKDKTNFMRSFN